MQSWRRSLSRIELIIIFLVFFYFFAMFRSYFTVFLVCNIVMKHVELVVPVYKLPWDRQLFHIIIFSVQCCILDVCATIMSY